MRVLHRGDPAVDLTAATPGTAVWRRLRHLDVARIVRERAL